ncbi:filamentous hemagglutinin [Cupriavidus gilardii J11]|uniref:Filamentous hemagglutinin n=1 Tax=Cupriavidus gilardii J11 TaxID=936133 RepID=A0A562B1U1_9BURK|nr:hemagglutinin repeat-containing protein [Cupriavidus gilardii]TWG79034.1 filamentous hemagglutinin [Cupriavidus gilardii J11]
MAAPRVAEPRKQGLVAPRHQSALDLDHRTGKPIYLSLVELARLNLDQRKFEQSTEYFARARQASHTQAITQSDARSVVGASNGNVVITGGKDAAIIGSDLVAGRTAGSPDTAAGNLDIQSQNVTIAEGVDHILQESSASSRSSGLTVALVGTPYDTARNLKAAKENSSGVSRTMQTVRELGASALTVPQIAVSIGSNKSNSQSSTAATVSSGSSLTDLASSKQNASVVTGNTVAVTARTGDITIAGSGIAAEGDAALSAAKGKIDILSGQDTRSQRSDGSSGQIGDLGGSSYAGTVGVRSESHHIDTGQATQNTIRTAA